MRCSCSYSGRLQIDLRIDISLLFSHARQRQSFQGVVYCFFSLHDCVYGVQYKGLDVLFYKALFFINFTFIVSHFLLCHMVD